MDQDTHMRSTLFFLTIIWLVNSILVSCTTIPADEEDQIEAAVSSELIVGLFMVFVFCMIGFHLYLKQQEKKEIQLSLAKEYSFTDRRFIEDNILRATKLYGVDKDDDEL